VANIKTNPPVRNKPDDGLRALLRKHLPQMHWTTVETGMTQAGVPDSEFCYRGVQGWIECKATRGYAVRFAPFQLGWHLQRARQGGRSFIAVRRRTAEGVRRGAPRDELWLYAGGVAAHLAGGGLRTVQPLGVWHGGPQGGWVWGEVLALLLA
jgi:hypothetical protein